MEQSNFSDQVPSTFMRWDLHPRLQHIGIFTSFIALALTGLPIKYHYTGWAKYLTQVFGGFDSMFHWHLFSAAVMLISCAYHVVWQIWRICKGTAKWGMLPTLKDGKDIVDHLKYQLGLSGKPAQYDKYSWKEKFDYLAVFWGMAAIGLTGIWMWFPDWAISYLPRWVIDCARIAHSDEAILAVVVIAVWHLYNVHFNPDFFPMSRTWFDGKMDLETMKHEHPLELAKLCGPEVLEKQAAKVIDGTAGHDQSLGS